jgi:geranylgeranyl diphosphate synthase type 3
MCNRVDDVEDSSVLRRGIPVAHSIFGVAQTINSSNYVYFKALQDLAIMGNPKLIEIYTEELLNLHRGQGMDLYWRDSLTCPSEADYLEMVGNKTGGLFRLAIKLMQAESAVNMYVLTHFAYSVPHTLFLRFFYLEVWMY